MSKITVYNQEGKEVGEMTLPKEIFDVKMSADLVHQVAISHTANKRQVSAHTKNRSEVRGGGRKPWRQKGTGRARAGSTRSPIWVGGGVSGGPRNEKNFSRIIPAKMRRKAVCMVLTQKAKENLIVVMDELQMQAPKTKTMATMLKKLPVKDASRLVLYTGDKNIFLAARNIESTGVMEARNVSVVDLLNHKYVLMTKEGIKTLETNLLKK